MEIRKDYYPDDLALMLFDLMGADDEDWKEDGNFRKCVDCLYDLMACAENPMNNEHFRTMWEIMQRIAERHERGYIGLTEEGKRWCGE